MGAVAKKLEDKQKRDNGRSPIVGIYTLGCVCAHVIVSTVTTEDVNKRTPDGETNRTRPRFHFVYVIGSNFFLCSGCEKRLCVHLVCQPLSLVELVSRNAFFFLDVCEKGT